MGKLEINGAEFTGENFSVKGGILYIEGHQVADLKHDSDYIYVSNSEKCNITTDKKIVICDGNIYGSLSAETIIINGDNVMPGAFLTANKIVDNR